MLKKLLRSFTSESKDLKKYQKKILKVNLLENSFHNKSDLELKDLYNNIKNNGISEKNDQDILILSIIREVSKRVLHLRPHDVQLIGSLVIKNNSIAEMKTGEGKTLTAGIAAILLNSYKRKIHIVTVNEYLAKRDHDEIKPLFDFFDITSNCLSPNNMNTYLKKFEYESEVLYGTNNEFAFDYLKNNLIKTKEEKFQPELDFAIIDEVDSVLIDEARTPLIISGPVEISTNDYILANNVAIKLKENIHFEVIKKEKVILLNEDGLDEIHKLTGIENLYTKENGKITHNIDQALKAHYLYHKDEEYVLTDDNEIVIIDEHTGRLSDGRRYSEGLHQAIEAKENVLIKDETQTIADISFQNFFRLYKNISGMTGTAINEALEFFEIYKLNVIQIPTDKPIKRIDKNDLIFMTETEKNSMIVKKLKELQKNGQPVLLGTSSVEKSELYHKLLTENNIEHTVLNAKNHEREAEIIKEAGNKGKITVCTNMAGRGVDIKITEEVKNLGGLYILGTERYENSRIDDQLRGRSGRQGDNGETQFYLALDDKLLTIFGGEKIKTLLERIGGVDTNESIESNLISKSIRKAQKTIEELSYQQRKSLLEFDDVLNEQRKTVYSFRNNLLEGNVNLEDKIKEYRRVYIKNIFNELSLDEKSFSFDEESYQLLNLKLIEEIDMNFSKDVFGRFNEKNVFENLIYTLEELYTDKFLDVDSEFKLNLESNIFLDNLDKSWNELKYEIDNLRSGINLRNINQKDPILEFKKETFHMFMSFKEIFNTNAVKILDIITIQISEN
jgi:preprotein translocase subunit SecA